MPASGELSCLSLRKCQSYVSVKVRALLDTRDAAIYFAAPVDAVALNLPDYHDKIKNPMDLGTLQNKLLNCDYRYLSGVYKHSNISLVYFMKLFGGIQGGF